jgi:radical SAM superfamily enzyme YgiQ (UPF0313 family)
MKKVTLVELTAFDKIIPLASAYLLGYARQDRDIRENLDIRIYDAPVTADRDAILADLERDPSDVYALSCYLWNMGMVRWLMDHLAASVPGARFILGGPQVMNHATSYSAPGQENISFCNGEGEITFQSYLREILRDEPDLAKVPGLSFWRGQELVTTERPPRLTDLDEIPSPFTSGLFEPGKYTFGILETNRGCPYNCGFCFWGAATNSKVNRFSTERVLGDITWMSEHGFGTFFLADANWGLASRDIDFTRHMVECRERTGYPMMVSINSAKNKPDRVTEIIQILVSGGLLTSQPISLQSTDEGVLHLINRSNIRRESYTSLQRSLREQEISSYIEMIWPLPGETLDTFRKGVTELCRSQADTILLYPQLLLHNTPIYENRERFAIEVERVPDEAAEADVVVGTNWVTRDDYETGLWIYYAQECLYNLRGLYYLANYLDRTGQLSFGDLFTTVAGFLRGRPELPLSLFIADSVRGLGLYHLVNTGELAHLILHAEREQFDTHLADFVATQPFWADLDAQAMFELDLLARPYIYREYPRIPSYSFSRLRVERRDRRTIEVTVPQAASELLSDLDLAGRRLGTDLLLRHPMRRKLAFRDDGDLAENFSYCQGMTLHLRELLAEWTTTEPRPGQVGPAALSDHDHRTRPPVT